jgi:hypothetical protein
VDVIVVEGYQIRPGVELDIRDEVWPMALDQRAFGPRRLVVAFADGDARLIALANAPRTDPPELALGPCIQHSGFGAAAAVALCDEPVKWGPPSADVSDRFDLARSIAADFGVRLLDWIACDDDLYRSFRIALYPGEEWWDLG